MNTQEHIVILRITSRPKSTLYYYKGNFYYPNDLKDEWVGRVRGAIRKFLKENKEMVERDRKDPSYKTLVQLFDEQMSNLTYQSILRRN